MRPRRSGSSAIQTTVASNCWLTVRRRLGGGDHVAAADVDLVGERQRHGLPGDAELEIAVEGDDALHGRLASRGQDDDAVARRDLTRRRPCPAKPRKSELGRFTHCTGSRNGASCIRSWSTSTVSRYSISVGPAYQGIASERSTTLSPRSAESGISVNSSSPSCSANAPYCALDLVEALLRVVDEIHLVHGDRDVADPEQPDEIAVPPRLREHALARVEQDHGAVGGRGAGDHVARVLLVPRRVGDDVLAGVGREEAVGDVDRDPLLALGGEPVEEEREVELLALRAVALRVGLERGQLVLEEHLRLVEQPADQRALAVVDGAARDEAQEALVLVRLEVRVDVALDEVDWSLRSSPRPSSSPSRRPSSWSISRPCRSDVRASSISWMIFGSVSASDSIAPESG